MNRNIIIGAVFFLLIVLVTLTVVLWPGHYYYISFDEAEKLDIGDKVYLKGLNIAEVGDIILDKSGKVKITINIKNNYKKVLTDKVAFLIRKDNFIMGRKCIEAVDLKGKQIPNKGYEYEGYNSWILWNAAILKSKF